MPIDQRENIMNLLLRMYLLLYLLLCKCTLFTICWPVSFEYNIERKLQIASATTLIWNLQISRCAVNANTSKKTLFIVKVTSTNAVRAASTDACRKLWNIAIYLDWNSFNLDKAPVFDVVRVYVFFVFLFLLRMMAYQYYCN